MIKVKHFMDTAEPDDGARIWVEPFGLTRDLREMCSVHAVLPQIGPPRALWRWFENNPGGYEFFRGRYHEYLSCSGLRPVLHRAARASLEENLTLLHQGENPDANTGTALAEFLIELSAYREL